MPTSGFEGGPKYVHGQPRGCALKYTAAGADVKLSAVVSRGVHPKVVQELLGHSTISLTLDTYSHVSPALHAEVATHMQALFR
jgi:integrase